MSALRSTAGVIAAVVLAAVVCVLLYLGYWWVAKDSTGRDAKVRQDTYERQTSLTDAAQQGITDAQSLPDDSPQRKAIVTQVCRQISRISNPPADLFMFQTREC